ncbi:class I SAM-dependent methyltransferase [Salipaludibacillus sp. HK11]|uniref:class I SAM-dependent methyltransferase n=1 Tax=Salipaludibacillus sp. HK11 TaxID=3394320 RepID=UPI0039FC6DB2
MKKKLIHDVDYEEVWREGIKDWNGNMPKRMTDDQCEESFWRNFLNEKSTTQPIDSYSLPFYRELSTYFTSEDNVLEIGPGAGNYTFSIAEKVRSLTVVDPSKSVLHYLNERINHKAITFQPIHSKWETYQSNQLFSVVLGVNCFYRMFEIKQALANMNNHATKHCIIGMTTGPLQPHYLDLERTQRCVLKYPRRDYVHLLNVLYEMGIYADCKMVPLKRKYTYSSLEEAVQSCRKKVLSPQLSEETLRESLLPYLQKENGKWTYKHAFYGALISWKPTIL